MKIAIWHNLPSGGGKRALHDHIAGLKARGHQIQIWCPPSADTTYLPLKELATEHVVDLEWPRQRNWKDTLQLRLSPERALAAMNRHCCECAKQINGQAFDILFANSCRLFQGTPIAQYVKIPSVLYLGEPCRWLYEAQPRLPWLGTPGKRQGKTDAFLTSIRDWRNIQAARIQGAAEVENAEAFGKILANSLFSRESILRAYGLDADVCYLGTNLAHFRNLHLPREPFVVGIGSFTPAKNLKFVIESISSIQESRPKLVWIGNTSGEYLTEMIQFAQSKSVNFLPLTLVPDAEIVNILNRATALVYAPRLEPFGLAPIEAGACALPVIAVAEGGIRETVIQNVNGVLTENDPQEFGASIVRLLTDPELARRLGEAGRLLAEERWSSEAATDRLERRLYRYAGMTSEPTQAVQA